MGDQYNVQVQLVQQAQFGLTDIKTLLQSVQAARDRLRARQAAAGATQSPVYALPDWAVPVAAEITLPPITQGWEARIQYLRDRVDSMGPLMATLMQAEAEDKAALSKLGGDGGSAGSAAAGRSSAASSGSSSSSSAGAASKSTPAKAAGAAAAVGGTGTSVSPVAAIAAGLSGKGAKAGGASSGAGAMPELAATTGSEGSSSSSGAAKRKGGGAGRGRSSGASAAALAAAAATTTLEVDDDDDDDLDAAGGGGGGRARGKSSSGGGGRKRSSYPPTASDRAAPSSWSASSSSSSSSSSGTGIPSTALESEDIAAMYDTAVHEVGRRVDWARRAAMDGSAAPQAVAKAEAACFEAIDEVAGLDVYADVAHYITAWKDVIAARSRELFGMFSGPLNRSAARLAVAVSRCKTPEQRAAVLATSMKAAESWKLEPRPAPPAAASRGGGARGSSSSAPSGKRVSSGSTGIARSSSSGGGGGGDDLSFVPSQETAAGGEDGSSSSSSSSSSLLAAAGGAAGAKKGGKKPKGRVEIIDVDGDDDGEEEEAEWEDAGDDGAGGSSDGACEPSPDELAGLYDDACKRMFHDIDWSRAEYTRFGKPSALEAAKATCKKTVESVAALEAYVPVAGYIRRWWDVIDARGAEILQWQSGDIRKFLSRLGFRLERAASDEERTSLMRSSFITVTKGGPEWVVDFNPPKRAKTKATSGRGAAAGGAGTKSAPKKKAPVGSTLARSSSSSSSKGGSSKAGHPVTPQAKKPGAAPETPAAAKSELRDRMGTLIGALDWAAIQFRDSVTVPPTRRDGMQKRSLLRVLDACDAVTADCTHPHVRERAHIWKGLISINPGILFLPDYKQLEAALHEREGRFRGADTMDKRRAIASEQYHANESLIPHLKLINHNQLRADVELLDRKKPSLAAKSSAVAAAIAAAGDDTESGSDHDAGGDDAGAGGASTSGHKRSRSSAGGSPTSGAAAATAAAGSEGGGHDDDGDGAAAADGSPRAKRARTTSSLSAHSLTRPGDHDDPIEDGEGSSSSSSSSGSSSSSAGGHAGSVSIGKHTVRDTPERRSRRASVGSTGAGAAGGVDPIMDDDASSSSSVAAGSSSGAGGARSGNARKGQLSVAFASTSSSSGGGGSAARKRGPPADDDLADGEDDQMAIATTQAATADDDADDMMALAATQAAGDDVDAEADHDDGAGDDADAMAATQFAGGSAAPRSGVDDDEDDDAHTSAAEQQYHDEQHRRAATLHREAEWATRSRPPVNRSVVGLADDDDALYGGSTAFYLPA